MVNKLLIVAKREYMERVRSRWFVVMTLLVPLLISGAMMIPLYVASRASASPSVRNFIILDASGAALGERISALLNADSSLGPVAAGVPQVRVVSPAELPAREAEAEREVMRPKGVQGYLVLTESALSGEAVRYAGHNASSVAEIEKIRSAVRQSVIVVRLQREGVNAKTIEEMSKFSLRMETDRITERGRGASGTAGLFAGLGIGLMLFFSITFHGQNVLRGVLEEKTTRVAEVVISSVRPETLLAGKVVGVGAVGLTQQVAWLGITAYLGSFLAPLIMKGAEGGAAAVHTSSAGSAGLMSALGGASPAILAIALGYFLVGFVFYATLYAAAGSMVNSEQEAQQAAMPVMFLLMSTWIMVQTVLINPNSKIAVVLSWLPWSSPIVMPMRMGLTTVSPLVIGGSLAVALLGSIGAIWLSGRIYRVGMLMYGKKPSLAEVAKWIRYA